MVTQEVLKNMFTRRLVASMDICCPAAQEAVDRIVAGMVAQSTGNRGRSAAAEVIQGPHFDLLTELLCASPRREPKCGWSQQDILLVTGYSRDTWLSFYR